MKCNKNTIKNIAPTNYPTARISQHINTLHNHDITLSHKTI